MEKIMRPLNTCGVQFLIRQDKLKEGKAPVYVRITVNGEIIHFALKQWVNPNYWDNRRGTEKGTKGEGISSMVMKKKAGAASQAFRKAANSCQRSHSGHG
jgi:hypothetical protein